MNEHTITIEPTTTPDVAEALRTPDTRRWIGPYCVAVVERIDGNLMTVHAPSVSYGEAYMQTVDHARAIARRYGARYVSPT